MNNKELYMYMCVYSCLYVSYSGHLNNQLWKQQIGGVVYLHLSYEDPFVPQTQIMYHGSALKASLLW